MYDDVIQLYAQNGNDTLMALLMAAPIADEEKQSWIELIPYMKPKEKQRLMENLQEEIADFEHEKEVIIEEMQGKVMGDE